MIARDHNGHLYAFLPVIFLSCLKLISFPVRVQLDFQARIPQKIIDKIYHAFFTTKPVRQGTGLGLSLSYDVIVKENGGELNVNTVEGNYPEFIIHLPITPT